ncbi:MAG: 2-C-methyl-D-erythritol 4-phosphate cytidylyltransferase [Planctomycetes bacterium RBG_16_64_10]|nr:MAG: 2-C-methyl-D-erythritol 4-phosphate cytidylyltransferase [Planctomycetes bacterium RBG_16_64_10]
MARFAVIMPAAGKSRRFGDKHYKKPFAPLAGRAVWLHAADKFLGRNDCVQLILAVAAEDREWFDQKFAANAAILGVDVVEGGAERADSVHNALARVKKDVDFVAVHDAARPCIADAWITEVFQAAVRSGAAILAIPVTGTLKRVASGGQIQETLVRDDLWEAQTPQVFRRAVLEDAYARRGNFPATDDAQLVERAGTAVTIVRGSPLNVKISTRQDLRLAELALKALPKPRLDGPAHPFADDRWR